MLIRPKLGCDGAPLRDIEIKCYPNPWLPHEFGAFGRLTKVGVADGKVVGYYCIKGAKLLRFAITPAWRRMGLGRTLMEDCKAECGHKLTIVVPESSEAVFFLRECGFKGVNIIPKAFSDLGVTEDGLYFLWRRSW